MPNAYELLVRDGAHRYGGLTLPEGPVHSPPTDSEVTKAIFLASAAMNGRAKGYPEDSPYHINDAAHVACAKYKKAVLEASAGETVAPAWFQAWNENTFQPALREMKDDISTLKDDMKTVKDDVRKLNNTTTSIRKDLTLLMIRDATQRNAPSNVGDSGPFVEVPFPDGRNPWGQVIDIPNRGNVTLPKLVDKAAIESLSLDESRAYYTAYLPDVPLPPGPQTLRLRKEAIAHAIGRVD